MIAVIIARIPTNIVAKINTILLSFLTSSFVTCLAITFPSSSSEVFFFKSLTTAASLSPSGYLNLIFSSFSLDSSRQVFKSLYISLASAYLFLGFFAVAFKIMFSTD